MYRRARLPVTAAVFCVACSLAGCKSYETCGPDPTASANASTPEATAPTEKNGSCVRWTQVVTSSNLDLADNAHISSSVRLTGTLIVPDDVELLAFGREVVIDELQTTGKDDEPTDRPGMKVIESIKDNQPTRDPIANISWNYLRSGYSSPAQVYMNIQRMGTLPRKLDLVRGRVPVLLATGSRVIELDSSITQKEIPIGPNAGAYLNVVKERTGSRNSTDPPQPQRCRVELLISYNDPSTLRFALPVVTGVALYDQNGKPIDSDINNNSSSSYYYLSSYSSRPKSPFKIPGYITLDPGQEVGKVKLTLIDEVKQDALKVELRDVVLP
ncbi:MAG: hypothetical protein GC164_06485 [Phycisphaera sp.]|nr:hypothetical protein [Phycisphaera sp.]